jgi:hypothetical protein
MAGAERLIHQAVEAELQELLAERADRRTAAYDVQTRSVCREEVETITRFRFRWLTFVRLSVSCLTGVCLPSWHTDNYVDKHR